MIWGSEEHRYNKCMKDIIDEITNMIQEYEDRIPAAVAQSEVQVICQIIDDLDTLKRMVEDRRDRIITSIDDMKSLVKKEKEHRYN